MFVIPDNVAIIGASAFENCSSLLGVEIGEGVVQIGTSAFAGCTKLETIVFNAIDCAGFVGSDTVHNNNVFANAGSRSDGISVTIGSSVKNVPSGLFYPQEYSVGVSPNITSLEIENGVENIGMYAFANLTLLNSISVSASVKTIGYCSFYRCLGLENLNFASGAALETIGRSAFNYCYNLEEIVIPNSVKTIDYCAFYRCSKLKNLTIGTGVQTIGDYAFACDIPDAPSVLENLVVKTSNLTIAASMFGGCANLLTLDTNSNVADNGFASATQIQNLTISESVLTIGSEAFADSIKNLSVKTSALTISAEMFGGCSSLETLHTNSDVSSAGAIGAAFWGCSTLKTLVVGQPQAEGVVTGIDLRANSFRETGLTSITLHEGVESIQSYAFYNTNITSVRIPASVRNVLGAPFLQCSLLTTIEIDDNNELFTDYDNNLIYGSSNKVLVDTCMGTDFSKLPTDIVTFGSYCLFNKPITSLTIPHTTTEIGYSALAYCAVMENLKIVSGV